MMTDDPTTPPPGGQPQAPNDMLPGDTEDYSAWVERLEPIARQRVGWMHDRITELADQLRGAEAALDEARSEIMRLQDDGSAYDLGYWRGDAVARVVVEHIRHEHDEARARLVAMEAERDAAIQRAVFSDQMAASTIVDVQEEALKYVQRLEASEAEVARLRDDCAALLKILDATYDGPLGRFTRDRIGKEIDAVLAATDSGRAPADQARRSGRDDE
jgi:hypothetical protein